MGTTVGCFEAKCRAGWNNTVKWGNASFLEEQVNEPLHMPYS